MEQKIIEPPETESLEEVIHTLKNLIGRTEDKIYDIGHDVY